MSEISFSSICDGVSLRSTPFSSVQVHGGNVKQGLNPGDLNVIMPSAGNYPPGRTRFLRAPTLDVIYRERGKWRGSAARAAETLVHALEDITTPEGDLVHCTSCEWSVEEGVLRPRGIRPPRLYPQRAGPHGNLEP
ncbi:MAG: DUF6838 family protein [Oscillospiraceae bacterium]